MLDKIQSFFGFTTMPYGRGLAPSMLFHSGDHAQAAARKINPQGQGRPVRGAGHRRRHRTAGNEGKSAADPGQNTQAHENRKICA